MYLNLVLAALCNMLYFALHVSCSGTFPKPLSAREERECLERIRSGDAVAKSTLIEHNLRLVAHIVKKYYAISGEQEDLISIGTIGLIKAASTFDYEKGTRFATYASKCIENEILMTFRSKRKSAFDVSISDPIDTDREGNNLTLMDIMSDEDDIVGKIDLEMKSQQLREYIRAFLDTREQQIVELRYGLGNHRPLTQREVAKRLNISRSYVSHRCYCKRCPESRRNAGLSGHRARWGSDAGVGGGGPSRSPVGAWGKMLWSRPASTRPSWRLIGSHPISMVTPFV